MPQIEQSYVMQRRVPKNAHWARQAELQKNLGDIHRVCGTKLGAQNYILHATCNMWLADFVFSLKWIPPKTFVISFFFFICLSLFLFSNPILINIPDK